jgi:urease accessory protein
MPAITPMTTTMRTITAMVTTTIPMTTDTAKLMRLQSWLSPAFPIGAYSYSHGLERAVEAGTVRDRATLVDWLDADLRHGSGRVDGIFFAETWRAARNSLNRSPDGARPLPRGERGAPGGGDVSSINKKDLALSPCGRGRTPEGRPGEGALLSAPTADENDERKPHPLLAIAELAAAMRASSELALESTQQGIAFLTAVRRAWPHPCLDSLTADLQHASIPPTLPIAAGMACAVHDIALDLALPLYLHAGAANLINAAVRLIPLGQTDGQMAMAELETAISETAQEALNAGLSEIGSAAFMIDIASMQHETQYTRLFRS